MISVSLILLCVFLLSVVFGALVGFVRGMNKSVIRLITLAVAMVLTFFASAIATNLIADKLLIEGQTLGEIALEAVRSEEMLVGILETSPLFEQAVLVAPALAIAIAVFPVMFLILSFISWIIFLCIQKPLRKRMFKEKFPKDKQEKKELKKQRKPFLVRLGKRFAGFGIGAVAGALIFGMLLTPVLGLISVLPENEALNEMIDTMVAQEILEASVAEQIKDGIVVRDEAILKSYRLMGLSLAGKLYLSSVSKMEYDGQKTNIPAEFDSVFSVVQVAVESGLLKAALDSENPTAIFSILSNREVVDALIGEMFNSKLFCAAIPEVMAMAMESVALSLNVPADKNAVYNNMMDNIATTVKEADIDYDGIKAYEEAQVDAVDYADDDENNQAPTIMTKEEYDAEIEKLVQLTSKIATIINTAVAGDNSTLANGLADQIVQNVKTNALENGNESLSDFDAESVKQVISNVSADDIESSEGSAQDFLDKLTDPEKFETDVATVETITAAIRETVQSAVEDTSKAQETASTLASVVCNFAGAVESASDENGNIDVANLDFTKIADAVTTLQNSNLKGVGSSVLDIVASSEDLGNNAAISNAIGALKDSYENGDDIGGTINSAGALIVLGTSIGKDGELSKEDLAKSFKDLVQNLNETTLKLLSSVLSEDVLLSMGVKKEYAKIAFDMADALLRELMELKHSANYEEEVDTVLSIYDILSAGNLKKEQMPDLVSQMLKSQVVMNTLERVSTDILSEELLITLDVSEKYAKAVYIAACTCIDEMLALRNQNAEAYNTEIDALVAMFTAIEDKNLNDKAFVKELSDFAKDSTVVYNVIMELSDSVVLEIEENDREDIAKGIEEYYAESGKTEKERVIFNAVAKIFGVEVTLQ